MAESKKIQDAKKQSGIDCNMLYEWSAKYHIYTELDKPISVFTGKVDEVYTNFSYKFQINVPKIHPVSKNYIVREFAGYGECEDLFQFYDPLDASLYVNMSQSRYGSFMSISVQPVIDNDLDRRFEKKSTSMARVGLAGAMYVDNPIKTSVVIARQAGLKVVDNSKEFQGIPTWYIFIHDNKVYTIYSNFSHGDKNIIDSALRSIRLID